MMAGVAGMAAAVPAGTCYELSAFQIGISPRRQASLAGSGFTHVFSSYQWAARQQLVLTGDR
jgi:hypothetical protein